MITKEDIHYLSIMVSKLKRVKRVSKCCSKKRDIVFGELLSEVFLRFGIPGDPKVDPDKSITMLEKFVFGQRMASKEDRKEVLTILRNL